MLVAVAAVLTFTATGLLMPLIIRHAIDRGMAPGADPSVLTWSFVAFVAVILVNFAASRVQETVVGKVAENVLFDMRRAMFGHLQRVSLSFMDKTETGRLMSRLQGDVNSMQEFLETSVLSVGDIALLFGIVGVMLALDWQLALLTLSVMPVLFVVRLDLAPARAGRLHGRARDELDDQRRAGRRDQRRARGAEHGPPARQLHALRRQGAGQPRRRTSSPPATPRSWCRSSTP